MDIENQTAEVLARFDELAKQNRSFGLVKFFKDHADFIKEKKAQGYSLEFIHDTLKLGGLFKDFDFADFKTAFDTAEKQRKKEAANAKYLAKKEKEAREKAEEEARQADQKSTTATGNSTADSTAAAGGNTSLDPTTPTGNSVSDSNVMAGGDTSFNPTIPAGDSADNSTPAVTRTPRRKPKQTVENNPPLSLIPEQTGQKQEVNFAGLNKEEKIEILKGLCEPKGKMNDVLVGILSAGLSNFTDAELDNLGDALQKDRIFDDSSFQGKIESDLRELEKKSKLTGDDYAMWFRCIFFGELLTKQTNQNGESYYARICNNSALSTVHFDIKNGNEYLIRGLKGRQV